MAKLRVPIATITTGGYDALVIAVTRRDAGQIDGFIHWMGRKVPVRWQHSGQCSLGEGLFDLDMGQDRHEILRGPLPKYKNTWHPVFSMP